MSFPADEDDTDPVICPKCGGHMKPRSQIGYDRHGREMEADWMECEKCGHQDSTL